jgi:hypothetical protein
MTLRASSSAIAYFDWTCTGARLASWARDGA